MSPVPPRPDAPSQENRPRIPGDQPFCQSNARKFNPTAEAATSAFLIAVSRSYAIGLTFRACNKGDADLTSCARRNDVRSARRVSNALRWMAAARSIHNGRTDNGSSAQVAQHQVRDRSNDATRRAVLVIASVSAIVELRRQRSHVAPTFALRLPGIAMHRRAAARASSDAPWTRRQKRIVNSI